jgi:hypothetical protein
MNNQMIDKVSCKQRFNQIIYFTLPALFLATITTAPAHGFSYNDDDELLGYDMIIKDLQSKTSAPLPNSSTSRAQKYALSEDQDPLGNVLIHAGVGVSALVQTIKLPSGNHSYLNQKGFQATLGIDLFSDNWIAEGAARSFGDSEDKVNTSSIKEFELKILYHRKINPQLGARLGGGVSGRYLTIQRLDGTLDYTTPTSVATMGLELFLSDSLSLAFEVSGRQSLIGETIDHSSADGTLRVDTHF